MRLSVLSAKWETPAATAISANSPSPITNSHAAPFINAMNIGLATRFAVFRFPAVLDQQFDVEDAGCLGSIGLTPDDFHEFDIPHVVSEKYPVSCANSRTGCERPDLFRITGKVAHGVFGERRLIKQQGRDAVSRLLYAVNLGFNMSQACIRRRTGDHCDQKAVFQGFHAANPYDGVNGAVRPRRSFTRSTTTSNSCGMMYLEAAAAKSGDPSTTSPHAASIVADTNANAWEVRIQLPGFLHLRSAQRNPLARIKQGTIAPIIKNTQYIAVNFTTGGYLSVTEEKPNLLLPQAVQQQHGEGQGNHPQQVPDIRQQGQDGGVIDHAYRAGEIPALGWTVYRGGHRIRARDHVHNPTATETFRKIPRLVTSNPSYNAAMMGTGAAPMLAFRRRSVSTVGRNLTWRRVPLSVGLNTPANTQGTFEDQGADLHPFGDGHCRYTSTQIRRHVSIIQGLNQRQNSTRQRYKQRVAPHIAPIPRKWKNNDKAEHTAVVVTARVRSVRIPATVQTNTCLAIGGLNGHC